MNATEAWLRQLRLLYNEGHEVIPRGKRTREVVGSQVKVDMRSPMVLWAPRKLSYKFMAAEAWWIMVGSDRVADISPYNPKISQFSDDGVVFAGAYGPKFALQREYVAQTLAKDPSSRQAVINIWRENPGPSKDVPCTLSLQFLIRGGVEIHCVASMRSSDVWLGLPYDIFNFTMLTAAIALDVQQRSVDHGTPTHQLAPGQLHLTLGSSHLYEENFEQARGALAAWNTPTPGYQRYGSGGFRPDLWFSNSSTLMLWLLANAGQNWDGAARRTGGGLSRWYEENVNYVKESGHEADKG